MTTSTRNDLPGSGRLGAALRRSTFGAIGLTLRLRGFRVMGGEALRTAPAPFVIVCNHAALLDSILVICAARRRLAICGAKPVYFSTAARRAAMRLLRVVRVESREGFVRDCGALLARPEPILVYPEMGRNPDGLGPFREWAAQVVLDSGVAVIPCYIRGTTAGHDRRRLRLVVGEPFRPDPAADATSLTATLRARIEALATSSDGR